MFSSDSVLGGGLSFSHWDAAFTEFLPGKSEASLFLLFYMPKKNDKVLKIFILKENETSLELKKTLQINLISHIPLNLNTSSIELESFTIQPADPPEKKFSFYEFVTVFLHLRGTPIYELFLAIDTEFEQHEIYQIAIYHLVPEYILQPKYCLLYTSDAADE